MMMITMLPWAVDVCKSKEVSLVVRILREILYTAPIALTR